MAVRVNRQPEENHLKVIVACSARLPSGEVCDKPLASARVPEATRLAGAGHVFLSGRLGLFAPRGAEDLDGERLRFLCSRSSCRARFTITYAAAAELAIAAASAPGRRFKVPISCQQRAGNTS